MAASLHNRILLASLIWVIASFLVHELYSLDIWWHLAIGEDILQRFQVPKINLYSAGALNQPYHDSHWLFQVLLALFHRLAGLNGALFFMILIWGFTLSLLYRELRFSNGRMTASFLTFVVACASVERFLPRPEIISFLMIVLFYTRLRQKKYQTPAHIMLLAALQIIWVNCHGLFVIAPFMVGCYWLLHGWRHSRGQENHFRPLSLLLGVLGLCLLASPYGTGALEYSLLLFSEVGQEAPAHMKAVNELSPTFGAAATGGSAFWFFALLMLLTPLSLAVNARQVNPERLLIIVALGLAACTGRRNIVLFALVAAPFIAENFAPFIARIKLKPGFYSGLQLLLTAGLLLWSAYPLSGRYYLDMQIPARFGWGVTPDFFPHGLVEFIHRHEITGQVYNTNRLGGFYLYHLYPDRIPFQDGRWEIYGEAFLEARNQTMKDYRAWKRWTADYNISSALLHHTAPESPMLVPALYHDPQWSLVYYDKAAAFFVRNGYRGSAKPIDFSTTSHLPQGDMRLDSRFMLNAFYRNLGFKELLLQNLEQTLAFGYQQENILLEMAKTNMELNHTTEAERLYLKLLEINVTQIDALSELSFINYQRGQFQQALNFSARAVTVAPDNLAVRFNHAMVLTALGRSREVRTILNEILRIKPDYWKARRLLDEMSL